MFKGSSLSAKEFNSMGDQVCKNAEMAGNHSSERSQETALSLCSREIQLCQEHFHQINIFR